MKNIWLHSVRAYLSLGLFFYYKSIKVKGLEHIPKNKPILFLSNHQNALLDALLIVTKSGRFSYFLTRAGVFKKPLVSKLLSTFNMIPVYRIRDGWHNISNNNSIFSSCSELLHQKKNVSIFPEGSHNLNRTVRPLSKGFTRIVFETMERFPNSDLQLIPIGLNFNKAELFPDSTALYFGAPIDAKSYMKFDKNMRVVNLKKDVHTSISQLTTHIDSENYNKTLERLNDLNIDFLDPKSVNACIASNFENCKTNSKTKPRIIKRFIRVLFALSIIFPYVVWRFLIKPKIVELEFMSTFRFAVGITLVPLWILIIACLLGLVFSWIISIYFVFTVLLLALLTVKV